MPRRLQDIRKSIHSPSSVDSTGTGAGTVSISITSGSVDNATDKILAGGSYEITATPKSGSAIESIKVTKGSTTTTYTSNQTISNVSANQTVSVKFKSNIFIRGGGTIGGDWSEGHAMQANADGTKYTKVYEKVAGSSSGKNYEFKLYVNGKVNEDGNASISITGGSTTGTCTHQSDGYKNYVLNLKKEANVTIESDGVKITKITVIPTTISQKAVTFKKADGITITGEYQGVSFSTASADAVVNVYETDEISFKVKADEGKYIKTLTGATFTPAFSATDEYNGKIASVTSAVTVTPTAANKISITAKSNKSDRGTVQVDAEDGKAYPGQIVKVTVTPKNGVLKTLTYTYGMTTISLYPTTNSSLNATKLDVATVTAMMYDFFNKSGEALGAAVNDEVQRRINMVLQRL